MKGDQSYINCNEKFSKFKRGFGEMEDEILKDKKTKIFADFQKIENNSSSDQEEVEDDKTGSNLQLQVSNLENFLKRGNFALFCER